MLKMFVVALCAVLATACGMEQAERPRVFTDEELAGHKVEWPTLTVEQRKEHRAAVSAANARGREMLARKTSGVSVATPTHPVCTYQGKTFRPPSFGEYIDATGACQFGAYGVNWREICRSSNWSQMWFRDACGIPYIASPSGITLVARTQSRAEATATAEAKPPVCGYEPAPGNKWVKGSKWHQPEGHYQICDCYWHRPDEISLLDDVAAKGKLKSLHRAVSKERRATRLPDPQGVFAAACQPVLDELFPKRRIYE